MKRWITMGLILGFFLCAGCQEGGPEKSGLQSGEAAGTPSGKEKEKSDEPQPALALLPGEGELPGLHHDGKPFHYPASNLWEIINGAAEEYIDYGVVELAGVYTKDSEWKVNPQIMIYHMGTPIHAFGIFRQHRRKTDKSFAAGNEGIASDTNLAFYAGPYYVQIQAQKKVPEGCTLLEDIAHGIVKKIGSLPPRPELLTLLPQKGEVPFTQQYHPKEYMGFEFLKGALTGEFQDRSDAFEAFVIPFPIEGEAEEALNKLRGMWEKMRATPKEWKGGKGYELKDARLGNAIVFQKGAFLGGIRGDVCPEAFAAHLEERLGKGIKK